MTWLRRPPFHQTRWSWYVEPVVEHWKLWLNPRRQSCCGLRKSQHKLGCR